jgi:ubiquitin carboxyl-terminal hydrolase 12/46
MGLNRGHYISVVKSHGFWFLFDDEQVEVRNFFDSSNPFKLGKSGHKTVIYFSFKKIEVSNFEEFYGLTQDTNKKSETSYILFYESRES